MRALLCGMGEVSCSFDMSYSRIDRISEEIKRELSVLVREIKDPRVDKLLSILAVKTTKDLRYSKVHVSVMGEEANRKSTIDGLNSASGFIRREIASRLGLRYAPEFSFVLDDSIEKGTHILELLRDVSEEK